MRELVGRPDSPARRWVVRGFAVVTVGVAAGVGALVLRLALDRITDLVLTHLISKDTAEPAVSFGPATGPGWLLPGVIAAALALAVSVSRLAAGRVSGTDGVIAAVNSGDLAGVDARGAGVKLIATVVTLGCGGSGGTEGPVALVSAGLSSSLTSRLRLSAEDRAVLVAAAVGAAIGALFQAPIGGVLLAGELLRRRGMDWRATLVAVPATAIAYGLMISGYGRRPVFGHTSLGGWWQPATFLPLAGIGIVGALLARLYVWGFHSGGRLAARIRLFPECTAALSGVLVGGIGLIVPAALGTGYGIVGWQHVSGPVLAAPLWFLLALPFIKIVTTVLTLQSGGVGGVFGPAMVIGASTGAACWRVGTDSGLALGGVALFTVAGLATVLGAAVSAPLGAAVLAAESVGSWVPPAGVLVAVVVATALTGRSTLFPSQLDGQLHWQPSQLMFHPRYVRTAWGSVMFGSERK